MELNVAQKRFCALVRENFLERQNRNPQYSTRAFAKHLGVQPATISEIIRDKRRVSKAYAEELLLKLCVEDAAIQECLQNFEKPIGRNKKALAMNATLIDLETYRFISDWEHLAILSLVRTKGFKPNSSWIAKRLGISKARADRAVGRLFQAKLLVENSSGQWVRSQERLRTSDGVQNRFLQKAHLNNLELAGNALFTCPYDLRDEFAGTLPLNPKALPEIRKEVRRSVRRLIKIAEKVSEPTEVYKISLNVFPITQQRSQRRPK